MAISGGTKNVALSSEERTWRINIETPKGGDPVVTVYRETVMSDGDGVVSQRPSAVVTRNLSAVADKTIPTSPDGKTTITTAQLAGIIAAVADTWRQEDIDSPAPVPPAGRRVV